MGAVLQYSGKIYSYEDIEKAADFIEYLFGKNFFKSGVESIKDSDPSGAGMGREYSGGEAARLFLAWHRVREELAFGGLDGIYRPGRYGALVGSIWEDLMSLSEIPGVEETAAGLLDNHTFEKTIFLLFIASRLFISQKDIIFPGVGLNYFYDQNYVYSCVFPAPGRMSPFPFPEEKPAVPQISGCGDRQELFYIDMTLSDKPLTYYKGILRESRLFESSGTLAAVLCKIEFPSGTAGYFRRVSCCPFIHEKTSGPSQAEGFIKLNLPG